MSSLFLLHFPLLFQFKKQHEKWKTYNKVIPLSKNTAIASKPTISTQELTVFENDINNDYCVINSKNTINLINDNLLKFERDC